jgi:hypothetical protein
MTLIRFVPLATFALALLTGCSDKAGSYPSLNVRPIEKLAKEMIDEPVPAAVAPVAPSPSNPETIARIMDLVATAEKGAADFAKALGEARTKAKGVAAAQGSEAWVAAQLALTRVEAARAPVQSALAGLDEQRRIVLMGPPSQDAPALEEAVARVEAIDVRQARDLDALRGSLTPR